ncbi:MAG: GNAT family N-acetyltransferase [Proteobacteria bacterium]|nr:GNAT family N-acetyltransferase [Pseudomonadota bacterium]MBU1058183.1 GNAT family N-acetyltransferase [Pseudomonadota bacterium]
MKNTRNFSFRFLPARTCRAEILASVYGKEEQPHQLLRLKSLLRNPGAERLYFVLARDNTMNVALLQLCRERRNRCCFRIRGLHTHPRFRNRSLASRLLQLACKCVSEFKEGEEIFSFILPTNRPSLAAHGHAGFFPASMRALKPERHLCLVWRKSGTEVSPRHEE